MTDNKRPDDWSYTDREGDLISLRFSHVDSLIYLCSSGAYLTSEASKELRAALKEREEWIERNRDGVLKAVVRNAASKYGRDSATFRGAVVDAVRAGLGHSDLDVHCSDIGWAKRVIEAEQK